MADVNIGLLPFNEQIAFFRQKKNLGTRAWTDIWQEQHDHAFVVAGAMKQDLLTDLRNAVDKAIADGGTLDQFRKDFDDIVSRHGWSYNGGRGWRSRVIYETNLRASYQAGRFAQLNDPDLIKRRPYWRYKHSDLVIQPRQEHLSWDGLVLRHDDPWWQTHYPPNGWGCKCKVYAESESSLKKLGKSGPDTAPAIEYEQKLVGQRGPTPRVVNVPKGIDPGWGYTPGRSWAQAFSPAQLDELVPSNTEATRLVLPDIRTAPAQRVLQKGLADQDYVNAFLTEFGIAGSDKQAVFEDVTGEFLVISNLLFRDRRGDLKVTKRGRAPYVLLLADTIKTPDEIWIDFVNFGDKQELRRRYIARWQVENEEISGIAVFETGPQGWSGVTAFDTDSVDYIDRSARRGERIYVRE